MSHVSPPGRLAGRRILVTGAASGIGAATARRFAAEGAFLLLLDRTAGDLAAVAAELGAVSFAVDVTDSAAVYHAVEQGGARLGGLDGVVNAAGIGTIASFAATDEETWRRTLAVNLDGPYRVCRAALPFLQQARRASIVNISSGAALQPLARRAAYAASKGGLVSFTKVLALELAPAIRANVIVPGGVDTPMVADAFTGAALDAVVARYAMKRLGRATEIADAALYLMSDESSYVTGSTLVVDGGRVFH